MSKLSLTMSTAMLLVLAGCGSGADESVTDEGAVPAGTMADPNAAEATLEGKAMNASEFAVAMAVGDMFEIDSSRLALQRAQSPEVRKFAQMMVDNHMQSSAKLKALAGAQTPPWSLPTSLPVDKKTLLTSLELPKGAEFDTAYMNEQVTAHTQTLDMLQRYSGNGDSAGLKQLAAEMVPIVSSHLDMAKKIQSPMSATANQSGNSGVDAK